jgi:pantoate--beta-alanine ligase
MVAEPMSMPLVHSQPANARAWVREQATSGRRVALVPTMGALHEGHLELVRRARQLADCVVVTIFVNPTQFAPHEDFQRYPRTFEQDLNLLAAEQVDMVFAPASQEMYGERFSTFVSPPAVSQPLEGQFRPDHFRGVCTVVLKLFNILPAHVAVFGQKDYQQARVIADMVLDLDVAISLEIVPTVRQPDGLALSSRNRYLSDEERGRALGLVAALQHAAQQHAQGQRDAAQLEAGMQAILRDAGVDRIDYAAVVDPVTLQPFTQPISDAVPATDPVAIALIAAHVGRTRLIDNRLLYRP